MKEIDNIISLYTAATDDDDKIEILSEIVEGIDLKTYDFFLKELDDKDLDEFIAIEIVKVVSLYSPESKLEKTIQTLFSIVDNSDDDLVKVYALRGLGYFSLNDKQCKAIKDIAESNPDEDLQATAQMVLLRAKKN